eukprot:COSAG02_NODE_3193_length_7196_cov_3.188812_5_plen_109_part_00
MPLITTQYALNIKRRETLKSVSHRAYGRMPCVNVRARMCRPPRPTTIESKMVSLEAGEVYHVRYATENGASTQRRGERRIEVVVGPHDDDYYKRGPVVTVKDLTDPAV